MAEFQSFSGVSKLFEGIGEDEGQVMLSCLGPVTREYPKDAYIYRAGDRIRTIALIREGEVLLVQEDVWGNRNIIERLGKGETFASAYAATENSLLNVSAVAESMCSIVFLDIRRVLTLCRNACTCHNRLVNNLLSEIAGKNLMLGEKLTHISQRTTRAKIMSYLSTYAQKCGRYEFDIPFSRQQLADFLAVERSGLSLELGKMQKEGLIRFHKNHFSIRRAPLPHPCN